MASLLLLHVAQLITTTASSSCSLKKFTETPIEVQNSCFPENIEYFWRGELGYIRTVLGELGPGQLGPGQLGPGKLGPGQLGPGQLSPRQLGPGQILIPLKRHYKWNTWLLSFLYFAFTLKKAAVGGSKTCWRNAIYDFRENLQNFRHYFWKLNLI